MAVDPLELEETLDDFVPDEGTKLQRAWLTAEDVSPTARAADKEEVANYYLNEVRIWRSMRRILRKWYVARSSRVAVDITQPNFHDKMVFNEGYKQCLRDIYRLLPRPRENTNE